jgi:glutamate N-acetyltransferase/amino-acid N-acetyltransferase
MRLDSRWVQVPDRVEVVPGGGLPQGFRAAGVAAGIKPSGRPDVGLLVCDAPEVTSAARFTRSGTVAAPVQITRERCRLDAIRAVVVNSGNANAATGGRGRDEAAKMQGSAAMVAGAPEDRVAVCSTGVIGVQLPGERVMRGILDCSRGLAADGDAAFQQAIMTTDATEKRLTLRVALTGGEVLLAVQCKGAAMIQPAFATMLCFVQTDARLAAETADRLLGVTVERSFERISVDGQLSTNDTAILQASGASGVVVEPRTEDEQRLGLALDALLRQCAVEMVRDGEGARRVGRVHVRGGSEGGVQLAARAVANSPLVKTALRGGDPNWGRIVQAIGGVLTDQQLAVDVTIEGVQVCVAGAAVPFDEPALGALVDRDEVEYAVGLPGDGFEAEVLFSDLGREYVEFNSEYTT